MQRITLILLLTIAGPTFAADETPVKSRIVSVGLFKNGLTYVRRTLTVNHPGVYRVDDAPEPIHGTFWVESDAQVSTRMTQRLIEVPVKQRDAADFQVALAGAEVIVHIAEQGVAPVEGTVLAIDPPRGEEAWNRGYQQPRYGYYYNPEDRSTAGRMLVLATQRGRVYIDPTKIAFLEAKTAATTVQQRRPVVLFDVRSMKEKTASISISYLAKGMAWAPSYRVDISNPKTLVLRQNAVIKNELEPIDDAQVQLISGFPSVQFSNVTSPLALNTSWAQFFQQLNQRSNDGNSVMSNAVSQQAVFTNSASPEGGINLSANPTGEGVDLHYQDIGRQTLGEGDSISLETASGKATYDRIVEWIVPDTRHENNGYSPNDREGEQEAAWDALRFRNPLDFPMTTGPAMVVADGRFNGQQLSYWVNPGEETTLHITKSLSIRTLSVEHELPGSREDEWIGGLQYRRATIDGELRANNHRKETVSLVIRRRFSGELISADKTPEATLLEEGVYSVNKRNQLNWSLSLKPGEGIALKYRYTVLIRR